MLEGLQVGNIQRLSDLAVAITQKRINDLLLDQRSDFSDLIRIDIDDAKFIRLTQLAENFDEVKFSFEALISYHKPAGIWTAHVKRIFWQTAELLAQE